VKVGPADQVDCISPDLNLDGENTKCDEQSSKESFHYVVSANGSVSSADETQASSTEDENKQWFEGDEEDEESDYSKAFEKKECFWGSDIDEELPRSELYGGFEHRFYDSPSDEESAPRFAESSNDLENDSVFGKSLIWLFDDQKQGISQQSNNASDSDGRDMFDITVFNDDSFD
jgi:hypothetical protein